MQGCQAPAKGDKVGEQAGVGGQRYASEVGLEEGRVPAMVFRTVKDGVDKVKEVFWTYGFPEVAGTFGGESKAQARCDRFDKGSAEIGFPSLANLLLLFGGVGVEREERVQVIRRQRLVPDDGTGRQGVPVLLTLPRGDQP